MSRRDDLIPPTLGNGHGQEQLAGPWAQERVPLEQHDLARLLVQTTDLVDRHHAGCLALDQLQDLDGELRLRQLLPRRRGRRADGACLVTDPADEDVGRIGSQRAVVRRIELVDRVPDPGIGDDSAADCRRAPAAGASRP